MATHRVFFAVILVIVQCTAARAECPRGDLDPRFCDRDGDLVADPPTNGAFLNPRALIFAYTPVENPAVYRDVWSEFLDHLSVVTGLRVVFFPVQSNAAQLEAMRSGRLHVAGFNTGATPLAVNCAGFAPFTMMASGDGSYGYEMELITWAGSGIETVADIRGKTIAFTAPTSNSGFKAPTAILKEDYGLAPNRDYDFTFSGKHDNTVLGVVNRDYDVGAVANSVKARMLARDVIRPDDLRVLYTSGTFPTTAFGHIHNLAPDIAVKVREAFATFEWEGTKLLEEFKKSGEEQFVPISYQEHWEMVRAVDRASGVSYGCR